MALNRDLVEAARVSARTLNGQFPPLWMGGVDACEVTYPQFAASPAELGSGGTYFHLARVSTAGPFEGATCLFGRGGTGSRLVLSLYVESAPGVFRLRGATNDLVSHAASAVGEVSGSFGVPVQVEVGDLVVLGLSWATSGSGSAPSVGQRAGVLPVRAPYGLQVRQASVTSPPSTLTFQSMTVGDRAPWIGLYK
ncbi:hypothetical protein [Rhodococcus sp. OK519]|uniref:hypothetical protein n=1 Tax=Rhodococcus sp. OK519 TaxID=2135729 RepID=UPI000D374E13